MTIWRQVLEKILKRTYRLTKDKGGIFGINVMVSTEVLDKSKILIDTAIRVREENPAMKEHFKVIFTSAGDPVPWRDKIKSAGFTWLHVVPSVKGALRCKKAGVDCIVASGHEGGFHIAWEPLHIDGATARRDRCHCGSEFPRGGGGRILRRQDPGGGHCDGGGRCADGDKVSGDRGERLPSPVEGAGRQRPRTGGPWWPAASWGLPGG